MPIKVSCHCGQSFTAKDELRGQTLLCPKCHQPLTIGADAETADKKGGGMDDLFDEVGLKEVKGRRCPECGAAAQPNAVMCVECGLNFETGETLAAAKIRKAGERGHGEAAEVLLDKAQRTIAEDKAEVKKTLSQGAPAWVYFFALGGVIAFGAAMLLMPKAQAFWYTGFGLIGLGSLIAFVYWIRIVIAAFMDNLVHGLLCLIVAPYSLIYVIMRWKIVGGFFIMQLVGGAVVGLGMGLQTMSFWLVSDEQTSLRPRQIAPTSVVSIPADAVEGCRHDVV